MRRNINTEPDPDNFATGFVAALITLGIGAAVLRLYEWFVQFGTLEAFAAWMTATRFSVAGVLMTIVVGILLVAMFRVMLTY